MIDLTPLEVRQKKGDFRRNFRGYDAELVNDFLDLVADRMEELVKENMALSDSVESMQRELTEYREKERALSEALMTAQRLRDDARAHAQKEAELMLREAKVTAETARDEAARALSREEETLRQVKARRAQLVESFRRLLQRELSELDVIEETLELAGDREPAAGEKSRGGADSGRGSAGKAARRSEPQSPSEEDTAEGAAEGSAEQADWLSSMVEE